jgi:hypothetical protein
MPISFTKENTPGYTDNGLANLARAATIIARDRGLDMPGLPQHVADEIENSIRSRLTGTDGRNLSVRALLAIYNEAAS